MFVLPKARVEMRVREIAGEDVTALKAALKSRKTMLVLRERMIYWKRDERRKIANKRR